jgi:DNA-binding winged helix-turn-helix (wHTH) protein/TolB-like protein
MSVDATGRRVRFGVFEFDLAAGELYREGQRVRLQEQPRQILAALIERHGDLVTRDELRERLWKTDTFVDFEHGLNTGIKKVRQALGDSAETPQFIETYARRGYRFIAVVNPVDVALESPATLEVMPPGEPVQTASPPRRLTTRVRWLLLLSVIVVAAAVAWLASLSRMSDVTPSRSTRAELAVLPLRVLTTSSKESAYLGVGIADAITTRLANLRQIAVRPTAAVLPYAEGSADSSRVASALGVQHLIVGTIQETDETYRVSVQLVQADGVAVWGQAYDVPREGLLRLQDTVAEQVASALRVELTAPERVRLQAPFTNSPAAYDLYLRGRVLLANYTDANMREAIGRFEQALAIDPQYSRARAALATACAWFSVRFAYESEAVAWGQRAEAEATRALAQDPSLAEAHLALANAAGTQFRGFDWQTVLRESAAALAFDPSLDLAHVARMRTFYHLGRFDDARAEALRARTLNPSPSVETERLEVAMELFAGNFAVAARRAGILLERTDAPAVRHYLGLARFYLGDRDGARSMLASAKRGGQPDVRSQASLASVEAAIGSRAAADARAVAIARGKYMDHHVAYSLGATYAQLGNADESLVWLQRAADTGFPCMPWFERDTMLEPLRRDPRFATLLDRLRASRALADSK